MDTELGCHIRFKSFELDLHSRELYRNGLRMRLHGQPIEVLAVLVTHPGQMVTRETLRKALWPDDTFVDFEHSLNSAINRLREALGDNSDVPRFIETIPRFGYRFIAPVAGLSGDGRGRDASRASSVSSVIPVETRIRLAVIPFDNLSDEPQDHLCDGLSTQIIVQLGRVYKQLSVIGPVSSHYFTAGVPSFPRIAEELKVDYLLVGSVWRVPPRMRIFTQLIRTADQCCVWSESYTRQDADILAVLDMITDDVSRGLVYALPKRVVTRYDGNTTPPNYELYLRARFFSYRFDRNSFEKAIGLFEQVIAQDESFAPAHAALALMLTAAMTFGGRTPQYFHTCIEQHASKALELCEENAEAHAAFGFLRCAQANWRAAEDCFIRALEINPSFPYTYIGYSQLLSALSKHEDAIATAKRGCELDPLSPVAYAVLGEAQFWAGHLHEAEESAQKAVRIEPGFGPGNATLSYIYEAMGEVDRAVDAYRAAVAHALETPLMLCGLARSLAVAQKQDEAALILQRLLKIRETFWLPPTWLALICAALGQRETAWTWLERSLKEEDPWRVFISVDPRFQFFANDPRFPDLLREVGLAQHQ